MEMRRQEVDIIEELRLRTWARQNYVAPAQRDPAWNPIVLDEMSRRDEELQHLAAPTDATASGATVGAGRRRSSRRGRWPAVGQLPLSLRT